MYYRRTLKNGRVMVGVSAWMREDTYLSLLQLAKKQQMSINQYLMGVVDVHLVQKGKNRNP
jgi:hypothetical protein